MILVPFLKACEGYFPRIVDVKLLKLLTNIKYVTRLDHPHLLQFVQYKLGFTAQNRAHAYKISESTMVRLG